MTKLSPKENTRPLTDLCRSIWRRLGPCGVPKRGDVRPLNSQTLWWTVRASTATDIAFNRGEPRRATVV